MRIVQETPEVLLNQAIQDYQAAKQNAEIAQQELEEAKHLLIYTLEKAGRKSYTFGQTRATVVVSETTSFDEPGLKKALGARLFNKFTTAKLDKKKLEAAMENNEVDKVVVSQYATIQQSQPFIRLSTVKDSE